VPLTKKEIKYEEILKHKILEIFGHTQAKIFLFGSRANGRARRGSDADIGIESIDDVTFRKLKMEFDTFCEESIIPFRVELIHFDRVDMDFKEQALKEIVIWKEG
jgi:predicted nucleotidyltransferase